MKKDDFLSEEQLNAFVDGELDPEERSRIYNEAERCPDLERRVCRQNKQKELVRLAYEDVPPPRQTGLAPMRRSAFIGRIVAACALLMFGAWGGFVAHDRINESAASSDDAAVASTRNFLLHVVTGEPQEMYAALEHARELLDAAAPGEVRRVEIVANEQGINLLRSDVTPYAREIRALADENVVFYACSRTIQRLEDDGIDVQLVPEAISEYTALDLVVMRMNEGWQYEKI